MKSDKSPKSARGIRIIRALASVKFILVCMGLAMLLVLMGTIAQVHLGTFEAQKKYFDTWFLTLPIASFQLPYFPGGLTVGLLWLLSLTASFITRFRIDRKDIGIFISHAGLILLLLGQLTTQWLAKESQMPIRVGESKNYSEDFRSAELVVVNTANSDFDEITTISDNRVFKGGDIHPAALPFYFVVHQSFRNAVLNMAPAGKPTLANQGIGTQIEVRELPPVTVDEEANNVTAAVELRDKNSSLGTWLLSTGLGAPQSVRYHGVEYFLSMRVRRYYYPFMLTLNEFRHDLYPGTDIPKNFSSLVTLVHPEAQENRQTLIYMNHPLRYQGKTFYQASFGEGNQLSILQIVDNPAAATPYAACMLITLGLLIQFMTHLVKFLRKSR